MSSVESKAVSSIRSQVVNLRQLLPAGVDMAALRQALLHTLFDSTVPLYRLSAAEWEQVRALSTARFETWAWNVARSPRCTIRKNGRLAAGEVDVTLEIDRGRIQELRIDGDWLDERETAVLASRFAGIKYDLEALTQQLQMIELPSHFERTSKQDFLDLLY